MRWQNELVFKRLKSLAQLGHVPKHDDRSSRVGFMGKYWLPPGTKIDPRWVRYFPLAPPTVGVGDRSVRPVNSVSCFTRSSKLSNLTSPWQSARTNPEPFLLTRVAV
jgi:hypothetical protein